MNKFAILALSVALASTASCSNAGNRESQPASATEQSATSESKEITPKNDSTYRPDMKVSSPLVLDFNATWCPPCKRFHPVFAEAARQFDKKATFVSIDVDLYPQTAAAFGVQSIPTVVILTPDKEPVRYVGTADIMPASRFTAVLNAAGIK